MIILGTNSIKDTGFNVANSCRFNDGDSAYMNLTSVSTVTNRLKFTISLWVKRSTLGAKSMIGTVGGDSSNFGAIWFDSSDRLNCTEGSGGGTLNFITNRVFRDTSAWYNIILAIDTTQGTEANRVKIYVNGVQETSFSTSTYPGEDSNMHLNRGGKAQYLGRHTDSTNDYYFDGYMAEVVWIDGSQEAPTSFGEFDEDSPTIWKPKNVSGLTFGNNGTYLDFEDSSNLGNDANGGTDWTETNFAATDQSTDTCTNNFATLNNLEYSGGGKTFSEGNTKQFLTGVANFTRSTIGVSKGKWYCEVKLIAGVRAMYGISSYLSNASSNYIGELGNTTVGYSYGIIGNTGRLYHAGSSTANWVGTFAANDIIMIAMDLDNYKLYFGKNGTWERSGDPTSGSTGTGAYTFVAPSLTPTGFYHFAFGCNSTSEDNNSEMNFGGSPPFAISSSNADGEGFGNFEYAVPSGYFSLCTKNLAEYG